jgi:hypothetical protein
MSILAFLFDWIKGFGGGDPDDDPPKKKVKPPERSVRFRSPNVKKKKKTTQSKPPADCRCTPNSTTGLPSCVCNSSTMRKKSSPTSS